MNNKRKGRDPRKHGLLTILDIHELYEIRYARIHHHIRNGDLVPTEIFEHGSRCYCYYSPSDVERVFQVVPVHSYSDGAEPPALNDATRRIERLLERAEDVADRLEQMLVEARLEGWCSYE